MTRLVSLIILLIFCWVSSLAQITLFQEKGTKFTRSSNENWVANSQTRTYMNNGEMHTEYLALNSDRSFVFVGHYEPWNGFAKGKWSQIGNKVRITWDSLETGKVLDSPDSCKKYEIRVHNSQAFRIEHWSFRGNSTSLVSLGFDGDPIASMKEIDRQIASIDRKDLYSEHDTSAVSDERGFRVGDRFNQYWFDSLGRLVKYMSRSFSKSREGRVRESMQIVHYGTDELGRVLQWQIEHPSKACVTYLSGPRAVYCSQTEDAIYAFELAEFLRRRKPKLRP